MYLDLLLMINCLADFKINGSTTIFVGKDQVLHEKTVLHS